jgi:hypothetical protein
MRCVRGSFQAVLVGAVLAGVAPAAGQADPEPPRQQVTPAKRARAEKQVKEYLEKIKGDYGTITPIKHEALERVLPGYTFFGVLYRQHPVGRLPPAGLKVSNVFAVADDRVEALTDMKELERYFKVHLPPGATDERLKDGVRAWLQVAQHLHQDGYFKFQMEDDSTKLMANKSGKIAIGKVVVTAGGNGQISGRLIYNLAGKLTEVSEDSKINPGPRPE